MGWLDGQQRRCPDKNLQACWLQPMANKRRVLKSRSAPTARACHAPWRRRQRFAVALALIGLLPLATWWLTRFFGTDQTGEDATEIILRGPNLPTVARNVIGWGSVALVALLSKYLWMHRNILSSTFRPFAIAVVASILLGLILRVTTEPTEDANIGGGIALTFGFPTVFALYVWALSKWVLLKWKGRIDASIGQ